MSFKDALEAHLRSAGVAEDLPPPPLEEDLPPPPEEEADALTEKEAVELVRAQIAAQRAAEGKAERGIINPPEAPEIAAATPEEAFEKFGDPPPPPAFKFEKAHRPVLLEKCLELGIVEKGAKVSAKGLALLLRQKSDVDPEALVLPSSVEEPLSPPEDRQQAFDFQKEPEETLSEEEASPAPSVGPDLVLLQDAFAALSALAKQSGAKIVITFGE